MALENCVNNDECDFCNNEDVSEKKLPELKIKRVNCTPTPGYHFFKMFHVSTLK